MICTRTFCADCVETRLDGICPNCGGNFTPSPDPPRTTAGRIRLNPRFQPKRMRSHGTSATSSTPWTTAPLPRTPPKSHAWLDRHNRKFGHWIDGGWTKPAKTFASKNPATGKKLADISQAAKKDVDAAVKAARKAQKSWAKDHGHRARVLYALARLVQKQSRLFAVLETLDNGKPIRESRDIDIPLVARHFYYHAGMAQLMADELPHRAPLGVCGQVIPWNFPLLMLAWKIAPALAMGNTVVLKPAEYTSLTALLFAELSAEAGVPPGVLNIVTGDGAVGEMIRHAPGHR